MTQPMHIYGPGKFIDVTEDAQRAGCTLPTFLTAAAWNDCVAWDEESDPSQNQVGRLWDVLCLAAISEKEAMASNCQRLAFDIVRVPRGGEEAESLQLLWTYSLERSKPPLAVVMLPDED